jgi:hypothetical protein
MTQRRAKSTGGQAAQKVTADLPFMSDEKLHGVIESLEYAAAVADSIWCICDVGDDVSENELMTAVDICRRVAMGLERTLKACGADLTEIHHEWGRRWIAAGSPPTDGE